MSEVSFAPDVACPRDRIRELLLDPEFLTAFVMNQHPVDEHISVTITESVSTTDWLVATEGIPWPFRGLVRETVPVSLGITSPGPSLDQDGSIHLDLKGKVSGQLRASLSLLPVHQNRAQTTLAVRGLLNIHIGFLGGKASNMARDHLIIPILGELAEYLEEWCEGPPS